MQTKIQTTPASPIKVKTYMIRNIEDHVDPLTGEVNATALAEDAAQHFNAYGPAPEYEIPVDYFEWAASISDQYEAKNN